MGCFFFCAAGDEAQGCSLLLRCRGWSSRVLSSSAGDGAHPGALFCMFFFFLSCRGWSSRVLSSVALQGMELKCALFCCRRWSSRVLSSAWCFFFLRCRGWSSRVLSSVAGEGAQGCSLLHVFFFLRCRGWS